MEALMLPDAIERQNRLLKFACEGGQMTAQHLRDLETRNRAPRWLPSCSKPGPP
jgi:hypothetical protein